MIFKPLCYFLFFIQLRYSSTTSLSDYINSVGEFFGYTRNYNKQDQYYDQRIPYEVSVADEKFISEAAKLTGVALSELDSCQHKVILKLQADCHRLNDEQVAKLAVQLLNCQSYVEGRQIYPCTDTMSIKDCTTSMDSDTWTSYHLMSNRARAVCYSIRQSQFRGLAEQTVNRLMESSQSQLSLMQKISSEQKTIHSLAQDTLETVSEGQKSFATQQEDMLKAQLHGQLTLEDNIKRLVDEKRLISESHEELSSMTRNVQMKLEEASKQIENQIGESKFNHKELLDDLIAIQNKAQVIFQRIEDSSKLLLEQSELAREQYATTLAQLAEVNATVHSLVTLVGGTKQLLEERLEWVTSALGGTDLAIERLYLIMWHTGFLLIGMVCSAFLAAPVGVRFTIAFVPPVNLALSLNGNEHALDWFELSSLVAGLILVHLLYLSTVCLYKKNRYFESVGWKKDKKENLIHSAHSLFEENASRYDGVYRSPMSTVKEREEETILHDDEFDAFVSSPTPPESRNGYRVGSRSRTGTPLSFNLNGSLKSACSARTRAGIPCKLSSLPGRDFCFKHQSGSSVIMS